MKTPEEILIDLLSSITPNDKEEMIIQFRECLDSPFALYIALDDVQRRRDYCDASICLLDEGSRYHGSTSIWHPVFREMQATLPIDMSDAYESHSPETTLPINHSAVEKLRILLDMMLL